MKALVKKEASPGIWLEDVPEPKVGPNDVLIEIAKTAICGTDMHIYKWDAWAQKTIPVPMAVGHEYSGRIVEMGSEVRGLAIGDRVSGEGHITCGYCRNCRAGSRHLCRNTVGVGVNRPGAFAQYLAIPGINTFKLTDYSVEFMEPELSWAQELVLQMKTRAVKVALGSPADPLAQVAKRFDPLTRQVELLSRLSEPNKVYAYCFCTAD